MAAPPNRPAGAVIEAHPALFARLTALSKVPPTAIAYLTAHALRSTRPPLLRGRWKPSDAKLDA